MWLLYGLHRWRQLQANLLFGLIVSSLMSCCCCCAAYIGELWWQLSNTGAAGTAARCRCGTAARLLLLGMLLWCLKRREKRLSISTYIHISTIKIYKYNICGAVAYSQILLRGLLQERLVVWRLFHLALRKFTQLRRQPFAPAK